MHDRIARTIRTLWSQQTGRTPIIPRPGTRKDKGFLLFLSAMAVLTVLSYGISVFEMVTYLRQEKQVRLTRRVGESIERVRADIEESRLGRDGYLLSGQSPYLVSYTTGIEKLIRNIPPLLRLLHENRALDAQELLHRYMQSGGSSLGQISHLLEQRGLMTTRAHFLILQNNAHLEELDRLTQMLSHRSRLEHSRLRKEVRSRIVHTSAFFALSFFFFAMFLGASAARIMKDIRRVNALNASLHHKALHDPLTGLSNRTFAIDWLECTLMRIRAENGRLAVLFIDLDRFKEINDRFGHDRGDLALVTVTKRFLGVLRNSDLLCRLGGDEFIVIVSGHSGPDLPAQLAGRLIATLSRPLLLRENERATLGASIGIAAFPEHGETTEDLLRKADQAMYRAKEEGGNRVCLSTDKEGTVLSE